MNSVLRVNCRFQIKITFYDNITHYSPPQKKPLDQTVVCTHFDTFQMQIPNIGMKIYNSITLLKRCYDNFEDDVDSYHLCVKC